MLFYLLPILSSLFRRFPSSLGAADDALRIPSGSHLEDVRGSSSSDFTGRMARIFLLPCFLTVMERQPLPPPSHILICGVTLLKIPDMISETDTCLQSRYPATPGLTAGAKSRPGNWDGKDYPAKMVAYRVKLTDVVFVSKSVRRTRPENSCRSGQRRIRGISIMVESLVDFVHLVWK